MENMKNHVMKFRFIPLISVFSVISVVKNEK